MNDLEITIEMKNGVEKVNKKLITFVVGPFRVISTILCDYRWQKKFLKLMLEFARYESKKNYMVRKLSILSIY